MVWDQLAVQSGHVGRRGTRDMRGGNEIAVQLGPNWQQPVWRVRVASGESMACAALMSGLWGCLVSSHELPHLTLSSPR
jgi:hypothetical protein